MGQGAKMNREEQFAKLYAKYPKLRAIDQATEEYFSGRPVTARCMVCQELLVVHHYIIEETGTTSTWIACPKGCTTSHFRGTVNKKE